MAGKLGIRFLLILSMYGGVTIKLARPRKQAKKKP